MTTSATSFRDFQRSALMTAPTSGASSLPQARVAPPRFAKSCVRIGRFFSYSVKGAAVFLGLLAIVSATAAIIGCLFLSNGKIAYLTNAHDLFVFAFYTRAGLKVNILFVTLLLFFMCINDGMISRRWFRRSPKRAAFAMRF
ncbi:MAG: hypothetical protein R3F54_01330 [Alphaproteobacteria bacterium]